MSKIEEALNKARKNQENALIGSPRSVDGESGRSNIRLLETSNGNNNIVKRVTSSKEIALMKDDDLLDNKQLSELKVIYSDMDDNKMANTYRDLRTKLIHKSNGKNFVTMITSCYSSVDSSAVALNLATAFSFDESKTSLIIDCNLKSPNLDRMLDLPTNKGLTDYLENENTDISEILYNSGIKRLRIVPAGASNESAVEYFTSLRIREMMSELLGRYSDRYIFLDAEPVTQSADTRILIDMCDYVLLVVPYARVTKKRIKEAADAIGKEKLLGVVFSDIPKLPKLKIPGFSKPV